VARPSCPWYLDGVRVAAVPGAAVVSLVACAVEIVGCVGYLDEKAGADLEAGLDGSEDTPEGASGDVTISRETGGTTDARAVDGSPSDASADDVADATPVITWHGTASVSSWEAPQDGAVGLVSLGIPSQAEPGDILLAGLTFGNINATVPPNVVPPTGWMLVGDVFVSLREYLYVYWARFDPEMTAPAWQLDDDVVGVGWISAYGGVDQTEPIAAGQAVGTALTYPDGGTSFETPTLSLPAGDMAVVSIGGATKGTSATPVAWMVPTLHIRSPDLGNGGRRFGVTGDLLQTASGSVGFSITANPPLEYVVMQILALQPP
jgi:hypothetical protein